MADKKYSLWLLLHDGTRDNFAHSIHWLAERFSAPVFEPHITLYGGIHSNSFDAVIAKCRTIAAAAKPISIYTESVGMEDDYFHSLYVRVRNTMELSLLFGRAQEAFGSEREFRPHISLLYGVIGSSSKEQALREHTHDWPGTAQSRTLVLYDTTGEVEAWQQVGAWDLGLIDSGKID